jgi:hypothetical protein
VYGWVWKLRLDGEQDVARLEVGLYEAATAALDLAIPGRRGRAVRRIVRRGCCGPAVSPRPRSRFCAGGDSQLVEQMSRDGRQASPRTATRVLADVKSLLEVDHDTKAKPGRLAVVK